MTLLPFRATLIEVSRPEKADPVLTGCRYETVKEDADGTPVEVNYLRSAGGTVHLLKNGEKTDFAVIGAVDIQERPPVFLGELSETAVAPANGEEMYEKAVFPADNDSLERRSIDRSGDSKIPEVNAARDAFFAQKTYRLRGCEAKALFDSDPDTFYDTQSLVYQDHSFRIDGGCLRVDCGREVEADTVEVEFFSAKEETREVKFALLPETLTYGTDFARWNTSERGELLTVNEKETVEVVRMSVHTTYMAEGKRLCAVFPVEGALRYLRLPCPPDRIYAVRVKKDGRALDLTAAHANNLQAPFSPDRAGVCKSGELVVPAHRPGSYLAVGIEGVHGVEGVYCTAEIEGENIGFPRRAPDYKANIWEHRVLSKDKNNTFYMTLPEGSEGKTVKITAVFADPACESIPCRVWLCEGHNLT